RPRERLFELLDDTAKRIGIGRHRLLVEQPREQAGVLRWREPQALAAQPNEPLLRFSRPRDPVLAPARTRPAPDTQPESGAGRSDLQDPPPWNHRHGALLRAARRTGRVGDGTRRWRRGARASGATRAVGAPPRPIGLPSARRSISAS